MENRGVHIVEMLQGAENLTRYAHSLGPLILLTLVENVAQALAIDNLTYKIVEIFASV